MFVAIDNDIKCCAMFLHIMDDAGIALSNDGIVVVGVIVSVK